mmetsp:Transcript_86304/g.252491  ORF Transcript_86304/g.252491 Transcript_86304/m.252491 type:complete len:276 (+) Transcript_86304:3074-3901(+)
MQVRLQHDHGEGEHEGAVCVCKLPWIVVAEFLRELLHHAVDLLRLARQTEDRQKTSKRLIQVLLSEILHVRQRIEDAFLEGLVLTKKLTNRSLVKADILIHEELRNDLWIVSHEALVLQVLNASLRPHVELVHSHLQVQLSLLLRHDGGVHRGGRAREAARGRGGLARRVVLAVALGLGPCFLDVAILDLCASLVLRHPAGPIDNRSHEGHQGLQGQNLQLLLLVGRDDVGVLHRGVLPLGNFGEAVHHALEDVLLVNIAVKVEKELECRRRIRT